MQYPQIYVGATPASAAERRTVRALALDLRVRLRPTRDSVPTLVLLHVPVEGAGIIDLVLARANILVVGAIRSYAGPIVAESGQPWHNQRGEALLEAGQTPLAHVGMQRDTLRARLAEALPAEAPEARAASRMIAALICAPALHPDSRIALDVDQHRALQKILGLDELAGLAAMASSGVKISEPLLHALVAERLGGQLWHDGNRLLFELAAPRYRLRLLSDNPDQRSVLPLIEGENVIGRRRTARPHEHRLTIAQDDRISSDHATISYGDESTVTLRDTSKNGTWFTLPGGPESFVQNGERAISAGTIIRMGETRMLLEDVGE